MAINQALWQINSSKPVPVVEINFDKEKELEEILCNDISLLNQDWLVIGRQVLTSFNKYIDLLAIDKNGSIIIIELKRDKTPRDVVAQAIDYASWVEELKQDEIVDIFKEFANKFLNSNETLEEAYFKKFSDSITDDMVNQGHQIVIVASSLDSSTERIVKYLSKSDIPLNVVFFKVFMDGNNRYISRAWLIEPIETEENSIKREDKGTWNTEYYVSLGDGDNRNWDDARKYGFISAGGGTWYSQTLSYLEPGDRVWVNIPKVGYVGVGRVKETVQKADQCYFEINGKMKTIYDLEHNALYHEKNIRNEDTAEYIVKVEWIKTVDKDNAIRELGFFGNQNSVCKPKTSKWEHTVNRLKQIWQIK